MWVIVSAGNATDLISCPHRRKSKPGIGLDPEAAFAQFSVGNSRWFFRGERIGRLIE
jgi:hypothetical protein